MSKLRRELHPLIQATIGLIFETSKARKAQGLKCVKMNATEDVGWLDSPSCLLSCVERLKTVKAQGLDVGLDFHGRLHKRATTPSLLMTF